MAMNKGRALENVGSETISEPGNGNGKEKSGTGPVSRGPQRRTEAGPADGLRIPPLLCEEGADPFAGLEWEARKASITDDKGKTIFVSENVEAPKDWSMLATNIVASKYFFGGKNTKVRESSVSQLVHRVARTIADWGLNDGYFASATDADTFYRELASVCVRQYGAFNSPVWFNVGLHQVYGLKSANLSSYHWDAASGAVRQSADSYRYPQASACFIQAVEDTMEDIMRLASTEAMLFKYGSGTGTDLSTLRSSREKLSGGGTPSGPLSFMRVFDQVAAVVKSGGKTRRAAKMQSLKVEHPDIFDFITCKMNEEKKAWALIDAGYDGSFGGEAYSAVMFQNANLSVRVSDEFMQAVEADEEWMTRAVTNGKDVETFKARELMRLMAESTHVCGDPGVQYDTTINRWHTCPESGRINASNPCSEYMFVDNSACNLASVNLMKFIRADGTLDTDLFRHVSRLLILAQEILVDNASYPSQEIARNSHRFRPLGLGYANLGAALMSLGLPYDSDGGRSFAALATALLTGYAYEMSADIAARKGVFDDYPANRERMLAVIDRHREALTDLEPASALSPLYREAVAVWGRAHEKGVDSGFRNAQVTLLAPTGTIGFMMDCDTTGIEPDIALVKYKQMAGGGMLKIVNGSVDAALARLGYDDDARRDIKAHIDEHETIEGAAGLKPEHFPVFDCAFKPRNGSRFIAYPAHLRMMAAVQPFLSGAISKTINMPAQASVDEIEKVYMDGWRMGLKSVAIYRDGSKRTQPLNTRNVGKKAASEERPRPFRRRMPVTRNSITHKFEVAGHEGYLTVGLYEDGAPGELFITMAKEGSTVGGIMDAFGTAISLCLQYGVPVCELIKKFSHMRFEPSGYTGFKDIPMAKSLVDYIFRWLELSFPNGKAPMATVPDEGEGTAQLQDEAASGQTIAVATAGETAAAAGRIDDQFVHFMDDAPACDVCGAITVRNGACYKCFNCGNSMGCS